MRCNVAVGLVCFILQTGAVAAQSGPNREAVQKQIETNERAIIEAIFRNDAKTFHSHVVGDSLILGGEGIMKVAEFDPMMKQTSAECKFSKAQISDSTFYWFNDTTLVHVYKTAMDASCNGEPIKPSWSSSVWVNKGGKWQGAFHQESEVAPPAPPKK
jgi:Domain of unknown function (DUF4440)